MVLNPFKGKRSEAEILSIYSTRIKHIDLRSYKPAFAITASFTSFPPGNPNAGQT